MQQEYNDIATHIIFALKNIPILTKEQVVAYAQKATGQEKNIVEEEINHLKQFREIISDQFNLSLCKMGEINRKDAIAFWAMTDFAEQTDMKFAKAPWPSSIIFFDERIYRIVRITVCDNTKYDADMIAMCDTHDKYHVEMIVGNGFDYTEINPDMLPKSEFIYANMTGMPLLETPEVKFKKVDNRPEEEVKTGE